MKTFDYLRPATISDAVAAAAEPGAAYLAAGTNLLDLMKGGISRPDRLVDVTRLPGLDRIEPLPDGGVRIGAHGAQCRPRSRRRLRKILSGRGRGTVVGRFRAASQCRDRRRQPVAANALRLFL